MPAPVLIRTAPHLQHTSLGRTNQLVTCARPGCGHNVAPSWPCWRNTAITPSSLTETATLWNLRAPIAATPRSRTPSAISSTAWGSTISPRDASPPTPPGWQCRSMAHPTLAEDAGLRASVWVSRRQPPIPSDDASSPWPGRITRKARRLTLHLPQGWPWQNQFSRALARLRALPLPS